MGAIAERSNMPNVAAVLRDEIARLARKELRSQTEGLKKASAQYRRDIAALKRQVAELERQVSLLGGLVLKKPPATPVSDGAARVRFTAKGLRAQRKRLGLSAADYAQLAGVSPQSVYNWEREITRPRKEQIAILAALRGMGKREAQARLRQIAKQKPAAEKPS
jgi:DNA-binding XRE family transcriptional regulator